MSVSINDQSLDETQCRSDIIYAGYGVWNKTCDATTAVRQAYAKDQREFFASNKWCGDPSHGDRKYLYILWEKDGVKYSGVAREHENKCIVVP